MQVRWDWPFRVTEITAPWRQGDDDSVSPTRVLGLDGLNVTAGKAICGPEAILNSCSHVASRPRRAGPSCSEASQVSPMEKAEARRPRRAGAGPRSYDHARGRLAQLNERLAARSRLVCPDGCGRFSCNKDAFHHSTNEAGPSPWYDPYVTGVIKGAERASKG